MTPENESTTGLSKPWPKHPSLGGLRYPPLGGLAEGLVQAGAQGVTYATRHWGVWRKSSKRPRSRRTGRPERESSLPLGVGVPGALVGVEAFCVAWSSPRGT